MFILLSLPASPNQRATTDDDGSDLLSTGINLKLDGRASPGHVVDVDAGFDMMLADRALLLHSVTPAAS